MNIEAGTRVGKYEIQSLIGEGGMGRVYRALDTELRRPAALKFLPAEVTSDPRRLERFGREALAASALNHPNIVTVYDIGQTADGRRFLATEFVDGETLGTHMESRRLKLGEVLDITAQVAGALVEAHAHGIVHRDIKPDNVMVRRDHIVKVLDFGLAKLTGGPAPGVDTEAATRALAVTDAGAVMGTVSYMSPEQSRGDEVDARTDVWSLGVVLYQMLTGRLPFRGKSASHTLVAIQDEEPPPLSAYLPDVPDLLQEIISDALAKDREARLTAKQMLAKLQRLKRRLDSGAHLDHSVAPDASTPSGEVSGRATASSQPGATASAAHSTVTAAGAEPTAHTAAGGRVGAFGGRRAWLAGALAAAALAGVGFGLYKFFGRGAGAGPPVSPLQSMKFTKLSVSGGTFINAISPDGKLIARAATEGGKTSLRLRQASAAGEREVVPPAEATYIGVTFAPDAGSLYYVAGEVGSGYRTLYRVPVIGGEPQKLIFDVDTPVTFSPDGRSLAFLRHSTQENSDSLVVADADGGGEQVLVKQTAKPGRPAALTRFYAPAWSPDGKLIAYMAVYKDDEGVYLTVEAADVSTRTTREFSPVRWRSRGFIPLAWVSDGSGLIVAGVTRDSPPNTRPQLWHVSYPGGEPYQITNDPNGYQSVSLTADSRTLLTSQTTGFSNVWVVPAADPARAAQVTNSTAPITQLAWTPDGRIVYTSRASGNNDLWVMNADGTGNRQLTFNPEPDFMPAVAPDGRIVFQSVRDGVNSLYRMNADGSGAKELVRNVDPQVFAQVSRDSQWAYYTPTDPGTGKVVLMRVSMEGGEPAKLREEGIFNRLSPDGQHFLAVKQQGGDPNLRQQMVVYPASGGDPVRTFDVPSGTQTFAWSPDGQAVDFVASRDGVTNVWRQPLSGGKPRQVTAWKTDASLYWLAWSFDGKNLAVVRDTSTTDLVLIQNFR